MHRKSLLAGFVAGAATVVVAMTILSSAGRTMPRALAQAAPPRAERPGGELPPLEEVIKSEVGQDRPRPEVPRGAGVTAEGAGRSQPTASYPRYQVSAWAYPGSPNFAGAGHGAYVLDARTGQVWLIEGRGGARKVGKVGDE